MSAALDLVSRKRFDLQQLHYVFSTYMCIHSMAVLSCASQFLWAPAGAPGQQVLTTDHRSHWKVLANS